MSRKSTDKLKYIDGQKNRVFKSLSKKDAGKLAETIAQLRLKGESYVNIAKKLNMSATLVRDFFVMNRPEYYQFKFCFMPYEIKTNTDVIMALCSMYIDGYCYSEISKAIGVPFAGIRNFISDNDWERIPNREKIGELIENLWSLTAIADYYGISLSQIKNYVRLNGIHVLSSEEKREKVTSAVSSFQSKSEDFAKLLMISHNSHNEGSNLTFSNKETAENLDMLLSEFEAELSPIERYAIGTISESEYRQSISHIVTDRNLEIEDGLWKYFCRQLKFYSKLQLNQGTVEDFYNNTICMFKEVCRPSRKPDLRVSVFESEDQFFFYRDHIIRGSRFWGYNLGSNSWAIEMRTGLGYAGNNVNSVSDYGRILYGKAKYSDFLQK